MTLSLKSRPRPSTQREFRYTRELYHMLDDSGVFDGAKIELIRGRLIEMPAMSDEHGASVMRSGRALRRLFPEDAFTVRSALPFVAADESEPEPDLCIVHRPVEAIPTHPSNCLLLIEISLSTLAFDRDVKASLYAESGVADYWIINLVDRVVEIYRDPSKDADGSWRYATGLVKRPGERCNILNASADVDVDPAELLPPP